MTIAKRKRIGIAMNRVKPTNTLEGDRIQEIVVIRPFLFTEGYYMF